MNNRHGTFNRRKGQIIKPTLHHTNYYYVSIPVFKNGKIRNKLVQMHKLIALTFLGPRPEGYHINHIDCNKHNNKPENLEYVTPNENMQHVVKNRLMPFGERTGVSKLTEEDVRKIMLIPRSIPARLLIEEFNCCESTIWGIRKGASWNHITGLPKKIYNNNRKKKSNDTN